MLRTKKILLISRLLSYLSILLCCSSAFSQSIDILNLPADSTGWGSVTHNTSPARSGSNTVQNGNGVLGVSYTKSKCGLDFTSASQRLGKRFSPAGANQPAAMVIAGIPAGATIEKALLYASASGNGAAQTATLSGPLGTFNYPMSIIGSGPDKCWSYSGSYAYRADVTSAINGNGTYNLSGLLTDPPTSGNDVDGATLLVIYSSPAAWVGNINISDGLIVVNGGTATHNQPFTPICGTPTNGQAFTMLGDIQMNGTTSTLNGTGAPFTWNWWNYVQVNTTFTTGQASSSAVINQSGDCFGMVAYGTYYRTACGSPITTSVTGQANLSCNGVNTGSAGVSASGGTGPYTYSWTPSVGTTSVVTGLGPGTYSVLAADVNGCGSIQTYTITEPSSYTISTSQTSVSCFGGSTGSATVTVSGATPPYTYTWSPSGGNAATATGLAAGNYTVTIKDNNNCTVTRTVSIAQPTSSITAALTLTNAACFGSSGGSASVSVSGGTSPYTYTWSPTGGNGISVTGLAAGNYTVNISDANGCSASRTVTITQPSSITAVTSATNITCNGLNNGSASVSVSGGTIPYSYTWNPTGGNAAFATGLGPGNYTINIKDANNCTRSATVAITEPTAFTLAATSNSVLCNGQSTGSATVNVNGATPSYSYTWNPTGGNASSASGLVAGNYTVNIKDANNCSATQTLFITEAAAYTVSAATNSVLCNGQSTGSATVSVSGATSPYSYTWNPTGGNTTSATGLASGNYTVNIKDANSCPTTQTLNIAQAPAYTIVVTSNSILCNGQSTGSATVSVSGATSPYSYTWSPAGGNGASASGLAAGNYTVNIKDANNCVQNTNVIIAQPTTFTVSVSSNSILCNGQSTGSATVNVSGATSPYSYTWNPTGGNAASASGLGVGNYTVNIKDANGCSSSATTAILQPPALNVVSSQTNVTCSGFSNGSASVLVSGGTLPYSYTWSPAGGNSASATGLAAGNYSCFISDGNNCSLTQTFNITQTAQFTITASSSSVTCFGASNGSASVSVSGGTLPYTYTWSPTGGNTVSATGLLSGNYTVSITDGNGCSSNTSLTITQPSSITATASATNVTCNGLSNGIASVSVSGGTLPYTYTWSPTGGNSSSASGLAAGNYTATITDANNCVQTSTVIVTQPSTFTLSANSNSVLCNGQSTGSATINVSGATPAYSYTWTPTGGNASSASGLAAGNYTVNIQDANNCSTSQTLVIAEAPAYTITTITNSVLCNGMSTGSATVSVSGATPAYSYTWSPTGGNTAFATGLAAGNYTVSISDANACPSSATMSIVEPSALIATPSQTDVTCNGFSNGAASVLITGGTTPYSYTWSPAGGNSATASGLAAGNYSCFITDGNSCALTQTFTIAQASQFTLTTSSASVTCFGISNGSLSVSVTGGTFPYTYTWSPAGGNSSSATGLSAGNYTLNVGDANGCSSSVSLTVAQPSSITAITSATNVTCNGLSNGTASVSVAGGTSPYTYTWSPAGGNASSATGIAAGNYTVNITDANTCSSSAIVSVTEPTNFTVSVSTNSVLCNGQSTGSATVSVSGATPAYSYTWSPTGGNANSASGLAAGNYTVNVQDANSCSTTETLVITEATAYTIAVNSSSILCNGQSTGSATVSVSGATSPYSYTWSPTGGNSVSATALAAGNYTVNVKDANGCVSSASTSILQPPLLIASMSTSSANCNNPDGSASVTVTGGVSPYTYTWSPSGGNANAAASLSAGSYTCTINDANLCSLSVTGTVGVISFSVSATATSYSICVPNTSTLTASGCTSYSWTPSLTLSAPMGASVVASPTTSTTYTVIGYNPYGCSVTTTIGIFVYPKPSLILSASSYTICAGKTTSLNASGASTYTWSPSTGLNNALISNPVATLSNSIVYTVSGINGSGCLSSATIGIAVNPLPTVSITNTNSVICEGNQIPLQGNGALTYTWNTGYTGNPLVVSPASSTVYSVNASNSYGCTNSATTSVTVNSLPLISISSNSVICKGQSTTLTASGGTTYTWTPGGVGGSITVSPGSTATYSVTGSNVNNCKNSAVFTVSVLVTPTLSITGSNTVCEGSDLILQANGGTTYTWSSGEQSSSVTQQFTGTSILTVMSGSSPCIGTASLQVTAYALPSVSGSANPPTILIGQSSQLSLTGSAGSYQWSPDAGLSCNTCANPVASPDQTTSYTVTVTDAKGCSNETQVLIIVDIVCGELFAPTAFSPNGDNNNDNWCVYGNCIDEMDCEIFNRWGQRVFKTNDKTVCWDGKVNGEAQNTGVFIYQISARLKNGDYKTLKGNFTLVK